MPHSWHYSTTLVQEKVEKIEPKSVLDVGPGYGKWGFLLREQLDWVKGRIDRQDWKARIVGLDVFAYQSPLLEWVYDEIVRSNILDAAEQAEGYDLVLLGDVLEHIEKREGLALLHNLVRTNRNVIIATPVNFFEQHCCDNEHEQHVSHWTMTDFDGFVFDYEVVAGVAMVATLAGKDSTWPTRLDMNASRFAFRMPMVGRHSSAARVLKHGLIAARSALSADRDPLA
jgi:2-polyprenyl-3-methyl-5-hydroxy-6-metoxy-1,4-benzoquinol methylase